jgi:tRNA threonylcarbamoyladenosine biosynthesis protein TsaB
VNSLSPLLLALDTSTSIASVGLFDGYRVVSETTWLAGREHSSRLLVEVEIALDRVGLTPSSLTGLVVARGPGSFTGVRVALSVAKGIAAGLSVPLWGVNSLDVLARAAIGAALPVRAVLEAGRGRYATALYERGVCVENARLATVDQLLASLQTRMLLIGELAPEAALLVEQHPLAQLAGPAANARRAGYLAELGWQLAQSGDPGDPAAADAIYAS